MLLEFDIFYGVEDDGDVGNTWKKEGGGGRPHEMKNDRR